MMNRLEFLKMMGNSLVETIREASAPLLEDEMEKLRAFLSPADSSWHLLGTYDVAQFKGAELKSINHVPVAVYAKNGEIRARKAVCPHCRALPQYIQSEHRFLCMSCGREFAPATETGTLALPLLATRKKGDRWYVRMERR